jgi:hypothetical protein
MSLRDATVEAGRRLAGEAKAWHQDIRDGAEPEAGGTVTAPAATDGQALFSAAVRRVAAERGISGEEAVKIVLAEKFGPASETPVVNLRRLPGEKFSQVVSRVEREMNLSTRESMRLCSERFPHLAAQWSDGSAL